MNIDDLTAEDKKAILDIATRIVDKAPEGWNAKEITQKAAETAAIVTIVHLEYVKLDLKKLIDSDDEPFFEELLNIYQAFDDNGKFNIKANFRCVKISSDATLLPASQTLQ